MARLAAPPIEHLDTTSAYTIEHIQNIDGLN
jgi:hypothetical protein